MRDHGTRAKYVQEKCRCDACRAANRAYYHQAKKRAAPATVLAIRARRHIADLRAAGMGTRQIAAASGIGRTAITKIIDGDVERIRPETEQAILGVSHLAAADRQLVDATRTWQHIEQLLAAGWTKAAISAAIGNNGRALQIGRDLVTVANARAIAALAASIETDDELPPEYPDHINGWEGDTTWMRRAACRTQPTWMFFAGLGDMVTVNAAKAVCATCSVAGDCLEYALRNNAVGVWGGTSGRERIELRRIAVAS